MQFLVSADEAQKEKKVLLPTGVSKTEDHSLYQRLIQKSWNKCCFPWTRSGHSINIFHPKRREKFIH
jgi:hypothetical protein